MHSSRAVTKGLPGALNSRRADFIGLVPQMGEPEKNGSHNV